MAAAGLSMTGHERPQGQVAQGWELCWAGLSSAHVQHSMPACLFLLCAAPAVQLQPSSQNDKQTETHSG